MKLLSLRLFLLPTAATAMVSLNSCCCPCETKAQLLEDFWVSPERQVEWLQQQRTMDSGYVPVGNIDYPYGVSK
jgi:hypothetical protein